MNKGKKRPKQGRHRGKSQGKNILRKRKKGAEICLSKGNKELPEQGEKIGHESGDKSGTSKDNKRIVSG